jgi:endo-1,4-beta-xylanase
MLSIGIWRRLVSCALICVVLFGYGNAVVASTEGEPTLRTLADRLGLRIGNVISDSYQFEENRELAAKQFNLGILEFYWFIIQQELGVYTFDYIDEQLAWAEANGMEVIGHALVYGAAVNPGWLTEGKFTREEYIRIMVDHIRTVVKRYAGRVDTWVVTNESHIGNGWYDFFLDKIGPEYVDIAFATAREANPKAILLYGDPSNETAAGEFTQHTRELGNRLKEKGLIDGLSLQFHLNPGLVTYEKQDMIDTLRAYGLPIYITEFDVDLRDTEGTVAERWAAQAKLYEMVMEVAIEVEAKSISVWGLSDKYSWKEYPPEDQYASPISDPCLFDDKYQPKPAYQAWIKVLEKQAAAR